MSEDKKEPRTYDLRKMEDLFECVEIVTMARGALYPVDARLASRLEKVSDALTAFSMNMEDNSSDMEQGAPDSGPEDPGDTDSTDREEKGNEQDPFDLLSDFPGTPEARKNGQSRKKPDSEEEGIIDIMTGEKIK